MRAPRPQRLRVHGPESADRGAVEQYIHAIYRTRFGADVRHFAPTLVSLHDADGQLTAAVGYRAADAGPLFLERYLAAPVEVLLSAEPGAVARGRIVEVGHLASARAGEGRRLITLMGPHLAGLGFQWVVSTLTEELRQLFLRLGIAPLALGVADPAVLGAQAQAWGRYYDHRPVVLAGQIEQALQRFQRLPGQQVAP
jgi:hypothetical protein